MNLWLMAVVLFLSVAAQPPTYCRNETTCESCISTPFCGWCSGNIRRLNGTWLDRKCFRQVDYGNEELCFDVISLDTCHRGYTCNPHTGRCDEALPGDGDTLEHCMGTCNCSGQPYCQKFSCQGGMDDEFVCGVDELSGSTSLATCENSCGTSAATPIPQPGNCTPP